MSVTRPDRAERHWQRVRAGKGTTMAEILRPGEKAPASGQYEEVGPRGGGTGHEVTVPKGKPLPPTSKPKQGYTLVDPTKNGSGRR
jgi:hypothetical protein